MAYREAPLVNVEQTASAMYALARKWQNDMAPYASLSLPELFDLLKNIPYQADPRNTEVLQRPWYTMNSLGFGGDCDDKAIATGAYCHLNDLSFRFVAASKHPIKPLHHVYTEIMINGEWLIFDPTYAYNVLGRPMGFYYQRLVLKP